jgi:cation transport regulator ChaB
MSQPGISDVHVDSLLTPLGEKKMPYSKLEELPDAVKKLPEKRQRQWLAVWNSAFEKCKADGGSAECEQSAFAQAWGVVKKALVEEEGIPLTKEGEELADELVAILAKATYAEEKFDNLVKIAARNISKGLIYGVVYVPDEVDTHGDFTSAAEIECAAHNFLPEAVMNLNHADDIQDVQVVESFIAPLDYTVEGQLIKKGSWVLVTKVLNKELLEAIEKGEINAYSLEGVATRLDYL